MNPLAVSGPHATLEGFGSGLQLPRSTRASGKLKNFHSNHKKPFSYLIQTTNPPLPYSTSPFLHNDEPSPLRPFPPPLPRPHLLPHRLPQHHPSLPRRRSPCHHHHHQNPPPFLLHHPNPLNPDLPNSIPHLRPHRPTNPSHHHAHLPNRRDPPDLLPPRLRSRASTR